MQGERVRRKVARMRACRSVFAARFSAQFSAALKREPLGACAASRLDSGQALVKVAPRP